MSDFNELIKSFPKTREYVRDFYVYGLRIVRISSLKVLEHMIMKGADLKAGLRPLLGRIMQQMALIFHWPSTVIY